MEHFYQNIPGWFSYEYIYKEVVDMVEDGDIIVEIGSYKGKSAAYMAVELLNSGKKVQFDCIDPCKLLPTYTDIKNSDVELVDGYSAEGFHSRLSSVQGYYNLIEMSSVDAANKYADNSISFIMIDGDHAYESVKTDVLTYLPKMKSGGIMVGDDAFDAGVWKAVNDALPHLEVKLLNGIHFYVEVP